MAYLRVSLSGVEKVLRGRTTRSATPSDESIDTGAVNQDEVRELATAEFTRRMRAGKPRGGFQVDDWWISEPYEAQVRGLRGSKRYLVVDFLAQGETRARGHFKLSVAVDPDTGEVDMLR
ncbi:hypothetical protein [Micromonospora sp. URMC 103]|uniref:hypothetical protein n=1 Tax=Micromonospora sp. URMC 103 TaxID=3423406 RepID=UPI003F1A5D48